MVFRIFSFLVFLALAGPVAATEHEVAAYGSVLETCYAGAEEGAHAVCKGQMAEACMIGQDDGFTTLGMVMCTAAEAQVWDKFLNVEYTAALTVLKESDADEAVYFPEFAKRVGTLRRAQRAWIAYRDAKCEFAYAMWGAGSMRNIAAINCALEMTAARTLELRNLGSEMR